MVDTVSTNAASINNNNNTGEQLVNANELYYGNDNNHMNILKNKAPKCNATWPLNMSQSRQFQNKKYCYYNKLPIYQLPASQPLTYRFYPSVWKSSNHYSMTPNVYNTTSGSAAYI
jgi:hypothetical protein